ncbi:MAG: ribonuclease P protein component [Gemmataceae bacterium]
MSDATPSFRFEKHEHLRLPREFRRVYDRRRSVSDEWLIVYAAENDLGHLRVGFSVSKKVVGDAVYRNRMRRLYREAFRLTRHEMPTGLDLILIPKRAEEPLLEALKGSLVKLVRQVAKRMTP